MNITKAMLEKRVKVLNEVTGNPVEPWSTKVDGSGYTANAGNFHVEYAFGGVRIERMSLGGGSSNPLNMGRVTKSHCYNLINAMIEGVRVAK